MINPTLFSLLTIFSDPANLEQKACDYFFSTIFKNEYAAYKVIEFENQTDTTKYWGIVFGCKNWDEKVKGQIVSTVPDKSTYVTANVVDIRIRKTKKNSDRLKIRVSSKIKVGDSYFVHIGAYRKLQFAEYYFIEFDKEGKIIATCKQGEII